MVHMAIKVERQLKKKGSTRTNLGSSSSWKSIKDHKEGGNQSKGKSDSQHSRNRDIECFKYLGTCHIASQCPNKRVMILRDDGDVETKVNQMMILCHLWRMLLMVLSILLMVN